MKVFFLVFALVVASSAAHACNPGNASFIYNGENVLLDSSGKMIVQPTSLLGSKLVERNGRAFAVNSRGAEIELEVLCLE